MKIRTAAHAFAALLTGMASPGAAQVRVQETASIPYHEDPVLQNRPVEYATDVPQPPSDREREPDDTESMLTAAPPLRVTVAPGQPHVLTLTVTRPSLVWMNVRWWGGGPVRARWMREGQTLTVAESQPNDRRIVVAVPNAPLGLLTAVIENIGAEPSLLEPAVFAMSMGDPPQGLSVVADAHVRDGASAAQNFGAATQIEIRQAAAGSTRETYLIFDLSALEGAESATLRLFGNNTDTGSATVTVPVTLHAMENPSWVENQVTWNNRPALGALLGSANIADGAARAYEWDVSDFVRRQLRLGRDRIGFGFRASGTTAVHASFNSKEAGANAPVLTVHRRIREPFITSLSPTVGRVGTAVSVLGENFGATQGTSTLTLAGQAVTASSWSETRIDFAVPAGASSGNVFVTVSGISSNPMRFTVSTCGGAYAVDGSADSYLEAELYSTLAGARFQRVADNARSSAAYMQIPPGAGNFPDAGTSPDHLVFNLNVTNGGTFNLWLLGSGPDTSSDSFWVQVDSGSDTNVNNLPAAWTWVKSSATVSLPNGAHTLRIKGREDGARIDKVLLTKAATTPSGVGGAALSAACAPPAPPTGLLARPWDARVELEWNTSNGATAYNVKRSTTPGGPHATIASVLGPPYNDRAVVNGTTYYYVVTAVGDGGESGPSAPAQARPDAPPATPTLLRAVIVSPAQVDLDWVDNATNETGYQVYRAVGSGGIQRHALLPANTTTYNDTTVSANTAYMYVVQAVSNLPSNFSNEARVTTPVASLSSLSPTAGPVGASVTLRGAHFGPTQGASTVRFGGAVATVTSWSATQLLTVVPSDAPTGPVTVTVGGLASNGINFTVQVCETSYRVNGALDSYIDAERYSSLAGTRFQRVNDASRAGGAYMQIPQGAGSFTTPGTSPDHLVFSLDVTDGGSFSLWLLASGPDTSSDSFWVSVDGGADVQVGGLQTGWTWLQASTLFPMPTGAHTLRIKNREDGARIDKLLLTRNGSASPVGLGPTPLLFCGGAPPVVTSLAPTSGPVGTAVTISGTGFGATVGESQLSFNGTLATPTSWSATRVVAPVPTNATTGSVKLRVGGVDSNSLFFTVTVPPPQITSLSPATGAVGTTVTIGGAHFGASQGSSTVRFNGTAALPTSWSNGTIVTSVPSGATSGPVVVTVNGAASNGVSFTVTTGPCTSGFAVDGTVDNYLEVEDHTNVAGTGFQRVADGSRSAGGYMHVPEGTGNFPGAGTSPHHLVFTLSVTNGGAFNVWLLGSGPDTSSDSVWFNIDGGTDTSLNGIPAAWTWVKLAAPVTLNNGTRLLRVKSREDGVRVDKILLTKLGTTPAGIDALARTPCRPRITSADPSSGRAGTLVFLHGTGFGASQGSSTVTFGGVPATIRLWSDTLLDVAVPSGAVTGDVVVTVNQVRSNGVPFTVPVPSGPRITSLSPDAGPVESHVTIFGENFGDSEGSNTVHFNGVRTGIAYWTDTEIGTGVPRGATTGNVVVTVAGRASNGVRFTVTVEPPPRVTSVRPSFGPVGTSVTITGTNFGATRGSSLVRFRGVSATPTSWSNTQIVVPVPAGATTGELLVWVGLQGDNSKTFTVTTAPTCPAYSINGNNHNYLEAEGFNMRSGLFGGFFRDQDESASRGELMYNGVMNFPDPGTSEDHLVYNLNVTSGGTFTLWLLTSAFANGASHSFWVTVDEGSDQRFDLSNTSVRWTRHNATLSLPTGSHTLRIKSRAPGAKVDKILLTKDSGFTPSVPGPTALSTCSAPPAPSGLTASGRPNRQICLSWSGSSSAGSYSLHWGTSSRQYTFGSIDEPGTSRCIEVDSSGVRYFFGARAYNAGGFSGLSNEASAVAGP